MNMMNLRILSSIIVLLAAPWAAAEIYKYTDENGNIVLTDTPPAESQEAEAVDVQEGNTIDLNSPQHKENEKYYERLKKKEKIEVIMQKQKDTSSEERERRIREAEVNLEQAKEVRAGDMIPVPSGGIRYTDQYKDRVKAAEQKLEAAKGQQ